MRDVGESSDHFRNHVTAVFVHIYIYIWSPNVVNDAIRTSTRENIYAQVEKNERASHRREPKRPKRKNRGEKQRQKTER